MPSILCQQVINECLPCQEEPILNISAESPDSDRFISRFAFLSPFPPIRQFSDFDEQGGGIFLQVGCMRWCWSTISQADADDCARRQAVECAFDPLIPNIPTPDQFHPDRISIWTNQAVTGTYTCPDGNVFSYTIAANTVAALTQGTANAIAFALAKQRAREHRVCISDMDDPICVDTWATKQITASGPYIAVFPATDRWELVSGTIPSGMVLETGFTSDGISLSGIPTTIGEYQFRVRCTISTFGSPGYGDFMEKVFTVKIVGINESSPLPDATLGQAYSQQLSASFSSNHELEVWSITSGSLPDGLTLSAAGLISGTPTGALAGYSFTVQAQFPVGSTTAVCSKQFSITTVPSSSLLTGLLFSNSLDSYDGFGLNYPSAFSAFAGGAVLAPNTVVAAKIINGLNLAGLFPTGFINDNTADVLGFPAGQFSYAFWLKINSISATGDILDRPGISKGYIFRLTPAGALTFFHGNGVGFDSVIAGLALATGTWYHIVATYDSGVAMTIRVSTEGSFNAKNSSVPTAFARADDFTATTLRANLTGTMDIIYDEIDCWTKVLSDAEAQEHWNMGSGIAYPF